MCNSTYQTTLPFEDKNDNENDNEGLYVDIENNYLNNDLTIERISKKYNSESNLYDEPFINSPSSNNS